MPKAKTIGQLYGGPVSPKPFAKKKVMVARKPIAAVAKPKVQKLTKAERAVSGEGSYIQKRKQI